jgi:hypothetical protein
MLRATVVNDIDRRHLRTDTGQHVKDMRSLTITRDHNRDADVSCGRLSFHRNMAFQAVPI